MPARELRGTDPDPARVDAVIDAFVRSRLLAVDRDAVSGEPTVEIAHEALLERWPRLAAWIEGSREDLWMRRRLTDAAAEWAGAGRDPGYLLAGSRLQLFASWAATTAIDRDASGVELLEASLAEQQRRDAETAAQAAHERAVEQRARTRERGLLAVVAIASAMAVLFGAFAFGRNDATREQQAIATARELAAAAVGSLRADPSLSLLLAVRAVRATAGRGYVVEEAMDAVHWALQESAVAYPTADVPFAVRPGPDGRRGVPLVPIGDLVALAERAAGRALTDEECRAYLHLAACPATPPTAALRALPVRVGAGVVPMERLAAASLAGTRVDVASALPVDLAPLLTPLVAESGVSVTVAAVADDDLVARLDAGTVPDLAIVARPRTMASLARQGRLVEMTSMVDVERLRARAGDELVHRGHRRRRRGVAGGGGRPLRRPGRDRGFEPGLVPGGGVPRGGLCRADHAGGAGRAQRGDGGRRPDALVPRPRGRGRSGDRHGCRRDRPPGPRDPTSSRSSCSTRRARRRTTRGPRGRWGSRTASCVTRSSTSAAWSCATSAFSPGRARSPRSRGARRRCRSSRTRRSAGCTARPAASVRP